MEWKYWKVVCRYGHVGYRNEVSVARYLVTEEDYDSIMVMDLASSMPGVKNNGVASVEKVSVDEYLIGKREEIENYYLQKLRMHSTQTA